MVIQMIHHHRVLLPTNRSYSALDNRCWKLTNFSSRNSPKPDEFWTESRWTRLNQPIEFFSCSSLFTRVIQPTLVARFRCTIDMKRSKIELGKKRRIKVFQRKEEEEIFAEFLFAFKLRIFILLHMKVCVMLQWYGLLPIYRFGFGCFSSKI